MTAPLPLCLWGAEPGGHGHGSPPPSGDSWGNGPSTNWRCGSYWGESGGGNGVNLSHGGGSVMLGGVYGLCMSSCWPYSPVCVLSAWFEAPIVRHSELSHGRGMSQRRVRSCALLNGAKSQSSVWVRAGKGILGGGEHRCFNLGAWGGRMMGTNGDGLGDIHRDGLGGSSDEWPR